MEFASPFKLALSEREYFGLTQSRVIPLRNADLSVFSSDEIALIDEVIQAFCGANASDVSSYSHLEYGWRVAEYKEIIPYETAFISTREPSSTDKSRAKELALCYGW